MIEINEYLKLPKEKRQEHLRLNEPCIERGGNSIKCQGLMAYIIDTTIPSCCSGSEQDSIQVCRPMKRYYRIVRDEYSGYEVQRWRWWFPFWMQCWGRDRCPINTHGSVIDAEKFIEWHRDHKPKRVVKMVTTD